MDGMISRAEHEEFRKTMVSEHERLNEEDRRQNKRLDIIEDTVRQIGDLTTSVAKLASSMESMLKEQERQGKRLETLESRDGEMWRKVVGYAATFAVGAVLAFLFAQVGM